MDTVPCAARIAIEKALLRYGDALPPDLRNRCLEFLKERIRVMTLDGAWVHFGGLWHGMPNTSWGMAENWRESTATLFDLAAEVQNVVGQSEATTPEATP